LIVAGDTLARSDHVRWFRHPLPDRRVRCRLL